jgi:tetratricopeptide (TPR) repeat protein
VLKQFFAFSVVLFIGLTAHAQQTQYFIDKEAAYTRGRELFDEKNYLSARQEFEKIYKQQPSPHSHTDEVMMQNLEYYIAVCATETNDKDAEQLLLGYYKKYHETDKRRLIYFYLGKYYYQNSNYTDAATYLSKVKVTDLSNEQIYDYKFELGYSYFTKKKFTDAKPLFASIKEIKDKYYYPANYYYSFICFYTKDYNDALKGFLLIEDSKMYSSVIPYYIAQIYFIKKDFDKTISYINSALEKDVMYKDEMRALLGQSYFQKSDYATALPLLEAYVGKSIKARKEDIYQLAYCQYQTGAYAKAIENFKQLNLLNEKLGQNATYALGDCYLKSDQKDKARSAFQSAASMDFDDGIKQNALFNYGKLSFELGFSTDAIQSFENYLEKYPSGAFVDETNELLAAALVETKNYERAYRIMETLKSQSVLIQQAYQKVTYFRAVELYNDKKLDEALALCDKSLKNPLNIDLQALTLYLKAEIEYNQGDYSMAQTNYQRFAQYSTPSLESKGEASKFRADYGSAYCYFKQKNYSDAAIYFGSAIDESGNTVDTKGKTALLPDLYLRYADCEFVTKNYSKAIDGYSKIVAMKWNAADYAQFRKGIILGLESKGTEKIDAMNNLISQFPTSNYVDQAYYEIGETYLDNGNNSAARAAYQSVILKYPNSTLLPRSYLKTAIIDYNSGKKEQSIDDYKDVVLQFPKSKEAKQSLDALKDIYVEIGKADAYVDFVNNHSDIKISSSTQDSLMYQSADNAYQAADCNKANSLYETYLSKFPNGLFSNEAHWNRTECLIKAKDFATTLPDFDAIIQNKYSKYYEKALLKASGIAFYELKDYNKAAAYYRQLYIASTSAQNTYTAMIGNFATAVKLNNNDQTIEYADQLINSGTGKDADVQEAFFQKGKAYYAKGNKEFAFGAFNRVTELPVSEKAVEAKYMVAKILNEQKNYSASLDTCFKLKDRYSSYEYWVAKAFVLMADNYSAQGNAFQAKATLESIIQNYDGDKSIIEEARTKLEQIRTDEMHKSKIQQPVPGDTLIMEQDSIIKR